MKVILRDDVENLGSFGEVVRVAPGYARNYLIPRGRAVSATPGNLKQIETEKEAYRKKAVQVKGDAEKVKAEMEALTLEFTRKAGEEDKLFGSVTSMDVEAALKAKGFNVEKRNIILSEPIKVLGPATVSVRLHAEVKAAVKVNVSKEL
ncbi:MAG: 50S ribosomal protein L9 [Deltaproteobacteria bacterium]|nr:50S ribosomal protein L9 [Deltaproteobacteria bacterium]